MGKSNVAAVFITDKNYHELTQFSVAGLCMFSSSPMDVYFYQVGYDVPLDDNLLRYASMRSFTIHRRILDCGQTSGADDSSIKLHGHISPVTLLKADAIEQVAHLHEDIVYMDGDVLPCRSFEFNSLFGFTTSFAAVYDFVSYMPYDQQNLIAHGIKNGQVAELLQCRRYLDLWPAVARQTLTPKIH